MQFVALQLRLMNQGFTKTAAFKKARKLLAAGSDECSGGLHRRHRDLARSFCIPLPASLLYWCKGPSELDDALRVGGGGLP